jgi:hypothetical protein
LRESKLLPVPSEEIVDVSVVINSPQVLLTLNVDALSVHEFEPKLSFQTLSSLVVDNQILEISLEYLVNSDFRGLVLTFSSYSFVNIIDSLILCLVSGIIHVVPFPVA